MAALYTTVILANQHFWVLKLTIHMGKHWENSRWELEKYFLKKEEELGMPPMFREELGT